MSQNCGEYGWVTDRRGYKYLTADPLSGKAWPPMPTLFRELAEKAAAQAGFNPFVDSVTNPLINGAGL